jgi:hypothetical protein
MHASVKDFISCTVRHWGTEAQSTGEALRVCCDGRNLPLYLTFEMSTLIKNRNPLSDNEGFKQYIQAVPLWIRCARHFQRGRSRTADRARLRRQESQIKILNGGFRLDVATTPHRLWHFSTPTGRFCQVSHKEKVHPPDCSGRPEKSFRGSQRSSLRFLSSPSWPTFPIPGCHSLQR